MNQLVPANPNPPACLSRPAAQPSHGAGGAPSVLELLQAQRARQPPEEEPAGGQCCRGLRFQAPWAVGGGGYAGHSQQPGVLSYTE